MIVRLNGEPREVEDGATVAAVVALLGAEGPRGAGAVAGRDGYAARGVAVAVDAEVVPRGEWEARRLAAGERIEVLRAIGGGA